MSRVIGDPTHATFGGIFEAAGERFAARRGGLIARSLVGLPGVIILVPFMMDVNASAASPWVWTAVVTIVNVVCFGLATALVMHHARAGRRGVPAVDLLRTILVMLAIGAITEGGSLLIRHDTVSTLVWAIAFVVTFYAYAAAARGCGVVESLVTSWRHMVARPGFTVGLAVISWVISMLGLLALLVGVIFALPFVACLQLEAEEQLLAAGVADA